MLSVDGVAFQKSIKLPEPKSLFMIRKTIMLVGLLFFAVNGAQTISADIIKGHSWEYQKQYWTSYMGSATGSQIGTIFISIDSVWSNLSDTLYFNVTEIDSLRSINTNGGGIFDTTMIRDTLKIHAQRINDTIHSSSGLVQEMFSSYTLTQYNTTGGQGNSSYSSITNEIFGGDTLNALQQGIHTFDWANPPFISADSLFVIDKIGLAYSLSSSSSMSTTSSSLALAKYCGKDFNYTTLTGIKTKYTNGNKTSPSNHMAYHKVLGRNTITQGYTLLGRKGVWKNGGFELLIQKK